MCTRGTCSRAVRRVCLTSARQPTSTTLGLNRSTTVRRRVRAAGAWARGSATACAHGIQRATCTTQHTTAMLHTKPTLARAYTLAQPAWPHPLCSHLPDFTHHKTIATVACVLREQRARCVPTQLRANPCYQQHAVTHACDRLAHRIDGQCGVQLLRRAHSASDCAQPVVVGGRAALAAPDYAAFSHRRLGRCSAAKAKAALGAESCADGRACGGQCDRSHGAIPMRPCVVCHARTVDRSV